MSHSGRSRLRLWRDADENATDNLLARKRHRPRIAAGLMREGTLHEKQEPKSSEVEYSEQDLDLADGERKDPAGSC